MLASMVNPPVTPSPNVLANLRQELLRQLPFAQMEGAHVDRFIVAAEQAYYAPGEVVLAPAMGPVQHLVYIRSGAVRGKRGLADAVGEFRYDAGELFPVGALLAERAVSATYSAETDCFCLLLPKAEVQALTRLSAPFADFLSRRAAHLIELSRRALQASYAGASLAEQSLEAPLASLPARKPLACTADTPLSQALQQMNDRHVGSVLVVDEQAAPVGILTRHDILGRVTLPGVPLATPIGAVMSQPLHALGKERTLLDAALLMSRHGIRHVAVTDGARLFNIVSERDLFALQRHSLKQLSSRIRAAGDVEALRQSAAEIRRFARQLLAQGVHARQLTQLISHLNDLLTVRLVELLARRHGLDLARACWVAFGSEGRSEQTIATDQDNGLVLDSDDPERDRPAWLAFADEVNQALDACGYPLCKGGVMARNPQCCLSAAEWAQRFAHWIEHGAPQDLLNASIYFDMRALAGRVDLVAPLRRGMLQAAARTPRFIKQMADNALQSPVPLNWRGAIDTESIEGRALFDLKHKGTALVVDAARLYTLAQGVDALPTRERLQAMAGALGVADTEAQGWVSAFEFLQSLRLRVQLDGSGGPANLIDIDQLNDVDRRMLRECLRVVQSLRQRIALDYRR